MAGIPFLGETLETRRMLVGDVQVAGLGREHWHVWRGAEGFLALCPLPSTALFLHNGSAPSLYQLLLPAARRDRVFTVGSRQFDPRHLGFSTAPFPGGFVFDTAVTGNSNRGHEFRDGPRGNGVIGPGLTDAERFDLIEFLKTP